MLSSRSGLGAIVSVLLALAACLVLQQALGNTTVALAITQAIPLAWVLAIGISQRPVEWIGLAAVLVFAVALAITALSGGGPLPLKLKRAVFPGTVGLACLVSIAIRRPLLTIAQQRLYHARPGQPSPAQSPPDAAATRGATVLTAIIADLLSQVSKQERRLLRRKPIGRILRMPSLSAKQDAPIRQRPSRSSPGAGIVPTKPPLQPSEPSSASCELCRELSNSDPR